MINWENTCLPFMKYWANTHLLKKGFDPAIVGTDPSMAWEKRSDPTLLESDPTSLGSDPTSLGFFFYFSG